MERAPLSGLMVLPTLVALLPTISRGKVSTHGLTGVPTQALGLKIRCMATVFSPGSTAVVTKADMFMTRNKEMEPSNGKTFSIKDIFF